MFCYTCVIKNVGYIIAIAYLEHFSVIFLSLKYRVDHKKSPIFCLREHTCRWCSKPRQNCFGSWIEHSLHFTYLSRQWRHSRRHWNTGWRKHTPKINLSKSDISPCSCTIYEIPILKKANGRSFLGWKNWRLFHLSAEIKSWPELLHWSVEDLLTAWMSSTLSGQCLCLHVFTAQKWCNSFYDRTLLTL